MEYKDLQKMTVKSLREEAAKHEGMTGVTGMKKDELVTALAEVMGIEKPKKSAAAKVAVKAKKNKADLKAEIKKLKDDRAKAIDSKDAKQLKIARFHIKRVKRELRRMLGA